MLTRTQADSKAKRIKRLINSLLEEDKDLPTVKMKLRLNRAYTQLSILYILVDRGISVPNLQRQAVRATALHMPMKQRMSISWRALQIRVAHEFAY